MQLALSAFVLAVSLARVSASAAPARLVNHFARQVTSGIDPSSIPSACQSTCAPILSTINTCGELSCLCNDPVAQQIAVCAECFTTASGGTLQQDQSLVDEYTNACLTSGLTVSSIQLSTGPAPSGASTSTLTLDSTSTSTSTSTSASASDSDSASTGSAASTSTAAATSNAAVGGRARGGAAGVLGALGLGLGIGALFALL